MGRFLGQRLVKLLIHRGIPVMGSRVGILGLTFKENIADLRNSRVPDIVRELREFEIEPLVHDPFADPAEARHEYGIELRARSDFRDLDAIVLAVSHDAFLALSPDDWRGMLQSRAVLMDVKSALNSGIVPDGVCYWSL